MTVHSLLVANTDIMLGGGEVGLLMLAEGLLQRGHRPVVALPGRRSGELATRLQHADVPFHLLGSSESGAGEQLQAMAARSDVVHLWSGAAMTMVERCGIDLPVLYHVLVPNPSPLDAEHARRADCIVANSRATAHRFPGHPVEVVYNGVAEPCVPDARLDLDPARRTIAIVGGTVPRKGQLDAVPALLEIVRSTDDVDVAFIGRVGGPVAMRLRRMARSTGDRLRLLGYVAGAANHLHELSLVLVPSRSEGFGRVAVEAMRAGVPVLARPVEGLLEALEDLRDPWLPADPGEWSARILRELDAPSNSPAELRMAAQRFAPEHFVAAIEAIHQRLARSTAV